MMAAVFSLLVATDHCAYSEATTLMPGYCLKASSAAFFQVSAASTPAMPLNMITLPVPFRLLASPSAAW